MKYFTLKEARQCLPIVQRLVRRAQKTRSKIAFLLEANESQLEITSESGMHFFLSDELQVNKEFHKSYYDFYCALEQISECGVIVKDIDEGLIDFPFQQEGRDAFFCWQLGEKTIEFWHDVCDGFEGRRPIVDSDVSAIKEGGKQ